MVRLYSFFPVSACLLLMLAIIPAVPLSSFAQDIVEKEEKVATDEHSDHDQSKKSTLAEQLWKLQTKVAELEAVLKENHKELSDPQSTDDHQSSANTNTIQNRKGMQKTKMMSSMRDGKKSMSDKRMSGMGNMSRMRGMSDKNMNGMGMMENSGMSMMGKMKSMGKMKTPSALPGFPGASHIYHIGSTNFFLDHPQHITLTQEQQTKLNQIKQQTLLNQATIERWIDEGEQELWILTSSDSPDVVQIETKVREVEKARGDKRIAFIREVGKAAQVLTNEQRSTLIWASPDHATLEKDNQN